MEPGRAYGGTLALGVQRHLFCCLCGGSAAAQAERREGNSPCPLAQEAYSPETTSQVSVDGSPWFWYLSPLEAASKWGACSQRDRARGRPRVLYFTPLEIRASKTERQPCGAHLSPENLGCQTQQATVPLRAGCLCRS